MENDLILKDSNAWIFRIKGEHLERKGLLTIAKYWLENHTIRKSPQEITV